MDTDKYFQAIGYVLAAIIAGGVAFIVAVLSKELKTSEFRQAWIDGLRTDISEMVAFAHALGYEIASKRHSGMEAKEISNYIFDKRKEDFLSILTRRNRIVLRLNPIEHINLISAVSNLAAIQSKDNIDVNGQQN